MPSIATEVRPGLIGALVFTAALAVSLPCVSRSECREVPVMRMPRPVIVQSQQVEPPFRWHADSGVVITPPVHPDARPWPHGMVITPPPTPDPIAARIPTALDSLLSALLAPWLSSAS